MVEKMMKDLNVFGVVVVVIKDGEVIILEGFGYCNIEIKEVVILNIWFVIGFLMKVFGIFLLSLLV